MNPYYQRVFDATAGQLARVKQIVSELKLIQAAFDKLPAPGGAAGWGGVGSVTSGVVPAVDASKCIYATGNVAFNINTFVKGDFVFVYNTTGADIVIGGTATLYTSGGFDTDTKALPSKAWCAVNFESSTVASIAYLTKAPGTSHDIGENSTIKYNRPIGYRDVPDNATGWVRGECNVRNSNATLNVSDCNPGYTFSIYNYGSTPITIAQGSGLTLRLAGTATAGDRTLAGYGLATIWCRTGTEAVMSGAGVT